MNELPLSKTIGLLHITLEPLAKVSKGTNFNEKREQTLYDGVI